MAELGWDNINVMASPANCVPFCSVLLSISLWIALATHAHVHMHHCAPYHCDYALAYCSEDEGLQLASANFPIYPPPHTLSLPFVLTPRWPDSAVTANRASTTSHSRRQALSLPLDKGQSLAIKATRWLGGGGGGWGQRGRR